MLPSPDPPMVPAPPSSPRTAQARLRRLKHGLNSKYAVIPGEDVGAFQQFRSDFLESLRPADAMESGAAEQLIMAQWQLQRVWKIQTGVYENFEREVPDDGSATHPMRLAQCFMADTATERMLDKMSLHQVRLVNAFLKSAKLLLLLGDLREKGLFRANTRRRFPDAVYARPDGLPEHPITPEEAAALRAWFDSESRENADRGENAGAPMVPKGVNAEATRASSSHANCGVGPSFSMANDRHGEANSQTAPTPSSDGQSGENADRDEGHERSIHSREPGPAQPPRGAPQDPAEFQRELATLEAETNRLRAEIDGRTGPR